MKKNLRTKFAAVVIAAAALVAAPVAAQAYTPSPGDSSSFTVSPGGTVTVPFTGFQASETVRFTLTGENAAGASLATVSTAAAVSTKTFEKAANGSGSASVTVTLPSNARGTYTLSAVGLASGATAPSVTLTAAAAAGDRLSNTGGDPASLAGVWIGGGALLAAGAALTGVALVRRRQSQDA